MGHLFLIWALKTISFLILRRPSAYSACIFKLSLGLTIASREHLIECFGDLRDFVYQVIILNLLDATILDKRLIF